VTSFAEAKGEKGSKTRTWFSLPDQTIFAVAGIWRDTPEWGPAYSMLMTEACIHVEGIHDRMPVILQPNAWTRWTHASAEDALTLCMPYKGEMSVRATEEPWVRR
jgi:putative SOS response-associated peptidase YedK